MSPTAVFNCAALLPPVVLAFVLLAAVVSTLLAPPARWCVAHARAVAARTRAWAAARRHAAAATPTLALGPVAPVATTQSVPAPGGPIG